MTDHRGSSYRPDLSDPNVFEDTVRTYAPSLIRYCYTLIGSFAAAEDVIEDAFAAMFVKGSRFASDEHLRGWLYRTVRNKSVDYLRRHRREVPLCDVENVLHIPLFFCLLPYRSMHLPHRLFQIPTIYYKTLSCGIKLCLYLRF